MSWISVSLQFIQMLVVLHWIAITQVFKESVNASMNIVKKKQNIEIIVMVSKRQMIILFIF